MSKVDKKAYSKIGIAEVNKFIKEQEIPLPPVKPTDNPDVTNVALIMDLYEYCNSLQEQVSALEEKLTAAGL